jgi:tRNA1Val (adenine37-N6)-methyltransferase
MVESVFYFKEFSVKQEKSGLKIGTDAIIIGALTELNPATKLVLDVGTGTGVIALMLAQKNLKNAKIIGIEINESAALEASENFLNSKWNLNLTCLNISFQEFSKHYFNKFDLIISNPPYFSNSLISKSLAKSIAKHNQELNFFDLVENSSKLLSPSGKLQVIIPAKEFEQFCSIAKSRGLQAGKVHWVKSKEITAPNRVVICFSFANTVIKQSTLTIRNSDNNGYTEQFKVLTKDYYL